MDFVHSERVRWRHLDPAQIIHWAAIFRFFESAEFEFFRSLGFEPTRLHPGLPRVHAEVDFLSPARLDDMLDTAVRVAEVREHSFTLAFDTRRAGQPIARGQTVVVQVDPATESKLPLTRGLELADPLRRAAGAQSPDVENHQRGRAAPRD